MRVISVVGARPQFIKLAPICWRINQYTEIDHEILHTGQHYDEALSKQFFQELNIPEPTENLLIGSGTHAEQTAKILIGVEKFLLHHKPDWILVYGDTNSTIGAALASTKLGIKVAHVEAGLRSGNKKMPEEINRIIVDHVSDLLFPPSLASHNNLITEGLQQKSKIVGDVMVETLNYMKTIVLQNNLPTELKIFATIHRAENTDEKSRLKFLIDSLSKSKIPINLFTHPRLIRKAQEFGISLTKGNLRAVPPASYFQLVTEIISSTGVITDSGGIQKEAYLLQKPCITMRNETEWPETLNGRWNKLDPELELLGRNWWFDVNQNDHSAYFLGDGLASKKIIENILNYSPV